MQEVEAESSEDQRDPVVPDPAVGAGSDPDLRGAKPRK